MLAFLLYFFLAAVAAAVVFGCGVRLHCWVRRLSTASRSMAFLHPFCADMAGGERVLWAAILAVQTKVAEPFKIFVYAGVEDRAETWQALTEQAQARFGLQLEGKVGYQVVKSHTLVRAQRYPYLTILGQSLGSMVLGLESLLRRPPHVVVDTTGYAFTYPIFRWLGGCTVVSYTHYPTVSTDMLQALGSRGAAHNNSRRIADSWALTRLKRVYYRLFAAVYGFMGRRAHRVMVNSLWTREHIDDIWATPHRTHVVYPPVNTEAFRHMPLERPSSSSQPPILLSIAQFRPEKDQAMQLRAFALLLKRLPSFNGRLVLVGSCRDDEDSSRVTDLSFLAEYLQIADRVSFEVNVSFQQLQQHLAAATVGLHTMWCEHFGIGVVEMQAAGLIVVAHNSGGPKSDIVLHRQNGFLASNDQEYANVLYSLFTNAIPASEQLSIRQSARTASARFSDEVFLQAFSTVLFSAL